MTWFSDNWIAVVALLMALVTFIQRQIDRRAYHRALQEQQARRVTMAVHETWEQSSPSSHSLEGWTLEVRNDSDLPVSIEALDFVWDDPWELLIEHGRRHLHTEPATLIGQKHLTSGQSWNQSWDVHEIRSDTGFGDGNPDWAILRFSDQEGASWERRSDTNELRRAERDIRWWQKLIQRTPGFEPLIMIPLSRLAIWSAHRGGPTRMPHSLRLFRWLWGYWAAGEPDPWLKPAGAPVLWGFAELPWTEDDQPGDT